MASDGKLYDWEIDSELRSIHQTRRELMASVARTTARAAAESRRLEAFERREAARLRAQYLQYGFLAGAGVGLLWLMIAIATLV